MSRCPKCNSLGGYMATWNHCIDCGYGGERKPKPVDLDACAREAFWAHSRALTGGHGAWEDVQGKKREAWLAATAAVLKAAGVKA